MTGAAFASPRTRCYCAPLFSHTHYWYTGSIFKLSGVYQNISTAVPQLFCGTVFSNPPTYSLYKRVKSSVHTAQQYHHMLDFITYFLLLHCRESVGTGPVVLKAVRVTGAAFASRRTKCYCAPLFSHTHYWYTVCMFKLSGVYQNISTAVPGSAVLFCGTVFSNPDLQYVVYTCKKFSAHGTANIIIYVGFQNIVIIAALPRVRWHRASSPQGSSSDGCCLCITTDQMLLCSSLFPHPLLVYREYFQIIGSLPK